MKYSYFLPFSLRQRESTIAENTEQVSQEVCKLMRYVGVPILNFRVRVPKTLMIFTACAAMGSLIPGL